MILVAGINKFRRLGKEDLFEVEEMELRNEETAKMLESQREAEKQEKENQKRKKK